MTESECLVYSQPPQPEDGRVRLIDSIKWNTRGMSALFSLASQRAWKLCTEVCRGIGRTQSVMLVRF
jgi:hypothetical protein